MPLNNEIERKWLIDAEDIPFDLSKAKKDVMVQGYISFSPTIRVRSENGERFILCVKAKAKGSYLAREEFETELTKEQFDFLLAKKEGNIIEKVRYTINVDGLNYEIDIFDGDLKPMAYLEIEFPNVEDAVKFKSPDWVIKDVTDDFRYKNAGLAKYGKPE
ncbi:MAG: CYTH domain-containing protein [Clostridia bacterium]|nr:CYTH domain-containing protein [Clostridia bacterium]